ncbi:hypothetical protein CDCA_CDCA01G0159 [Cyanidium caldarium]|uniref:Tail specific protease domain-containing protein n=1 Tax=Cyanidium caldarium TaxID=2771 RepID=A0AAV9IP79_CYACA|nr:hypothetical protein CDCA_CDCA01G0159 [Cyanidium caldarium]
MFVGLTPIRVSSLSRQQSASASLRRRRRGAWRDPLPHRTWQASVLVQWGEHARTAAVAVVTAVWLHCAPVQVQAAALSAPTPTQLIEEAYMLLQENYIDTRMITPTLLEHALSPPLPRNVAQAGQRIEEELLRPLQDRFTRYVPREQMEHLLRFDGSGMGMLLRRVDARVAAASRDATEAASFPGVVPRVPVSPGDLYVSSPPVRGSAADRAALQAGDVIDRIQGVDATGGRVLPFEAANLMQGVDGGTVTLTIRGRGDVQLVRRVLGVHASSARRVVTYGQLGRTGVIRIREFNALARPGVEQALQHFFGDAATAPMRAPSVPVQRLVLDLRSNGGGSLEEAIDVASLFLGPNVPLAYMSNESGAELAVTTRSPTHLYAQGRSLPMVVLVNDHTASASEVVAGALRDQCRAALVSVGIAANHTYGKALVQGVFGLSDGSGLVITVGKYVTPVVREQIQGRGLHADRHVLGLWSALPPWLGASMAEAELFDRDAKAFGSPALCPSPATHTLPAGGVAEGA